MTLECQENPKPQPDTYGSISLPEAIIIFLAVLVVIALLLTAFCCFKTKLAQWCRKGVR